jgi:type IV pilus assembly protein PilM
MANFLQKLAGLLQDPPPDWVFEITEEGVAYARPSAGTPPAFSALEPGILNLSPLADNVLKPDALADKIRAVVGGAGGRKRGSAVVILPDYSARVAVLGFDHFPADAREQLSLVRFRMKKSVPFDVESAVVSYHAQPAGKGGKTECLVAVAALEIVARYEAAFRAAGLHPGWVTTASMAMLELLPATGVSVLARISGHYMTVLVANSGVIRLVRTVELTDGTPDEILGVLFPTLAFVEDEMGGTAERIFFAGVDSGGRLPDWVSELQVTAETLKSRFGTPGEANAGLLGYLESARKGVVKAA